MISSFTVVSLLASVAFAQKPSPLIPSGISPGCSTFLTNFNEGSTLQACTKSLISATKSFSSANKNSTTTTDISAAASAFCSGNFASQCSSATVRSVLSQLQQNCQDEISGSSKNDKVAGLYEALYTLIPLSTAICATDDSNQPCILQVAQYAKNVPKTSDVSSTDDNGAVTPNMSAIGKSNLLFLLKTTDLSSEQLCTTCTRKVITAYTAFEADYPYAPGLANTVALSGQAPLYADINNVCGSNFLQGAVAAAGSLSGGTFGGDDDSAAIMSVADMKTVVSMALGVVVALAAFRL